ncbi:MAG TPA: hypothetical protein VF941_03030 [Clostridia bacterium]
MFNTFLDIKRRLGMIIFWWIFIVATVVTAIAIYKWAFPLVVYKTKIVYQTKQVYVGKYQTKPLYDLQGISNLDIVKFGNQTLCVSSIKYDRVANYQMGQQDPAAVINLRAKGDC